MKFYCDRCNAKYSIADEKVRGKIVKVRCKRCGDIITVSEDKNRAHQSTPEVERGGGSSSGSHRAADSTEWYYSVQGQTYGPVGQDELIQKYESGNLTANSYVWRDSFGDWKPASAVEPFSSALERQAESVSDGAPKRKQTMGVGDSIESVESAGGQTVVTDRSDVGGSSAQSGGARRQRAQQSAGSQSGGHEAVDEAGGGSRTEARRRRSGGGRSGSERRRGGSSSSREESRGGSRRRSKGRNRGKDRSSKSKDRGRDTGPASEAADESDDRKDRLNRLRDKLKSDFGTGSRDSSRRREEPERDSQGAPASEERDAGRGEASESSPQRAETPSPERAQTPSPEARRGPTEGADDEASEADEADASQSGLESANDILSGLQAEDETEQVSRDEIPGVEVGDDGGFDLEEAEAETEPSSESSLPSPGEIDTSESEAGADEAAAEESDDFSLPPPGSSRLGESDGEDREPEPAAESAGEPEAGESAPAAESKPELPTAPKLGSDEAEPSDQSGSLSEDMTKSLLIQLDKMKKENRGHRWMGAVAAVVFLAVGGAIGYYLWTNAGTQNDVETESEELETVIASEDDKPGRETYSQEEQQRILSVEPQKVKKGEEKPKKGAGDSKPKARNDESQTDNGPLARGSLTDDDGPTMDQAFEGAKRRSDDKSEGVNRNMEEGKSLKSSGPSKESSEQFEAMQAIEGSSPSVESPTDSLDPRGSAQQRMKLTKQQIREGIQGVRQSVSDCRRRHHRRGAPLDTQKIYLTLSVEPSGKVSNYSISPSKLNGSVLERCLASHTGRWGFGPFQGSTQKIKAPFILQ